MIRFEAFERLGAAVAAISDRSDGDCGLRTASSVSEAIAARQAVCGSCGVDSDSLVCAQQTHGTATVCVDASQRGRGAREWESGLPDTDGLITRSRGLPLAMFVADCVPVYLLDPETGGGGLVHAGREGTYRGISPLAVEAMQREFGTKPTDLHALIGPSAGPCCYEVSPELAHAFAEAGLPVDGRHLDLWQANAQQLTAAGLSPGRITVSGICTICDGRFHSHRAQPNAGRNMALLML